MSWRIAGLQFALFSGMALAFLALAGTAVKRRQKRLDELAEKESGER